MKKKKILSLWLWMPKSKNPRLDPNNASVFEVKVECTFKREISISKFENIIEFTYKHPRLNKVLTGTTRKSIWCA